jgi:hypothetical protein
MYSEQDIYRKKRGLVKSKNHYFQEQRSSCPIVAAQREKHPASRREETSLNQGKDQGECHGKRLVSEQLAGDAAKTVTIQVLWVIWTGPIFLVVFQNLHNWLDAGFKAIYARKGELS